MVARLRSSFSSRRLAVIGSLSLLSAFVLAMLAARMVYTGTSVHGSLAWDLFLAWVPFLLALVVYERVRAGAAFRSIALLACVWLAFFPNAPYLLTELRHVSRGGRVPALYDVVLLGAAGWAGLLLGLTSLFLIHAVARRFVGSLYAWGVVVGVLVASSFGIYLGRALRWNSWDLVAHPQWLASLLGEIAVDPLGHPRPLALMVLLTLFLFGSYLVLYSFARLTPEWEALERPRR
jgi:uncharacterized membrane protein